MLRIAALFAWLLLTSCVPVGAIAASSCMRWEDGVRAAAEWSHEKNDRVAAVLLTPKETQAVWAHLGVDEPMPTRLGVMIIQSQPDVAYIAGFDDLGCVAGAGNVPFGPVLDAMVAAGVKSEFVIVEPKAKGTGA